RTRQRLWAEHLELPAEKIPDDPVRAIDDLWKPISREQLERRFNGLPLTHRLVRLPHVSRRTRRILGPGDSLVVDGCRAMKRAVLVVGALALAGCNGGTVDRHALTNDTSTLDSIACEGALLAHDVAHG